MKLLAGILFSIVLTNILVQDGINLDESPVAFSLITVAALWVFYGILFWAEGKSK